MNPTVVGGILMFFGLVFMVLALSPGNSIVEGIVVVAFMFLMVGLAIAGSK